MLLYAPIINNRTNFPVLLWSAADPLTKLALTHCRIHGGSFISGSSTSPGLDGTRLANAASVIVVVVQYRLGAVRHFFLNNVIG
jgi:carboxylesterase type B